MIFQFFCFLHINSALILNDKRQFTDETGAIRIFHGFNVVYKQAPYIPQTQSFHYMESFSEEDCQILVNNGFNVIRLHVSFEAGMPVKGEVDFTYLDKILAIVRMAAKYKIYVILDAHQDLFNRQFCGNGFPDWATEKNDFPYPTELKLNYEQNGYPKLEDCYQQKFVLYYTTNDVGLHFEKLYQNVDGLADNFGLFWKSVAEIHKNEWNVIGYEIINEPAPGNFQKSYLNYVWPGYANKQFLMPFYKKIHSYIRESDDQKLIFFEADYLDVLGSGFSENIGGSNYQSREVFSYHVYCGLEKVSDFLCNAINSLLYWFKMRNVNSLNIGGFLTEFGAVGNDDESKSILDSILDTADSYQQSWTYWQYKGYNDHTTMSNMFEEGLFFEDGSFQQNKLNALSRPYAYQICANSIEQNEFHSKTQEYILKFNTKSGCQTKVFVPSKKNFDHKCQNCQLIPLEGQHYQIIGEGDIELQIQL